MEQHGNSLRSWPAFARSPLSRESSRWEFLNIKHRTFLYAFWFTHFREMYARESDFRESVRILTGFLVTFLSYSRSSYPLMEKYLCPRVRSSKLYAQITIFEILLNQTEIRLYLPCTDWFSRKIFQISRKIVNTIWFRFDLIRFRKDFSVCATTALSRSLNHSGLNRSLRLRPFFSRVFHMECT